MHLTRNLKTYGSGTATGQAYVRFDPTATVNESYVEFYQLGAGATDKMGIDIETTTGSCTMTGCVYRDSSDASTDKLYISGASSNNITLSYCNFAQSTTQGYGIKVDATTGTSITIDNCLVVGWLNGIVCGDVGITLTNCTVSGAQPGVGIGAIQIGEAGAAITGTFNNLTAHGNAYSGVEFSQQQISGSIGTINAWRNLCNNGNASDSGIKISAASYGLTFTGGTLFGNGGSTHSSGICITAGATPTELTFRNFTMCGDTTFPNQQAITLGGYYGRLFLEGCQLGVPTGIYTTHTSGDIPASTTAIPVNYILRNTTLGSPTEIINQSSMNAATSTYIVSEKHDQTAGLHYRWERNGTVNTDSSLFKTASPSLKMTPTSASIKLTATRYPFHFSAPVSSGQTITFTCYVQKSAAYNGAQPRLLVIENAAIGITVDTVLSTASGGLGSWLTLTGTTAAVTDDGVLEFTVDCDGTAGFVNVDDCSVSGAALDTTGLKYWFDGQPFVSGPAPIGAAAAAAKLVGFGGGLVS